MSKRRDYGSLKLDQSPYKKMQPADFSWVRWTEGFWGDRFAQCRDVTLPYLLELAEDSHPARHVIANFRMACGELKSGEPAWCNWSDAWAYKWIEAASAVYGCTGDEALDQRMDGLIDLIARAQEPDGYLATQIQLSDRERYQDPALHELYVMGHLLTAACMHKRATGKTGLLDVACRAGDHLWKMYEGHNQRMAHFPFNPSIIMGAVELYRTTGQKRYLDLANTVIDMRARFPAGETREGGPVHPGYGDQCQDRVPLRDESEVVGHAVFYTYLYAGAADTYLETGDRTLWEALERLWTDLRDRKMYITGGCCALHRGLSWRAGRPGDFVGESAGQPYELPNSNAYNETCSQYGVFLWNWRMLHATGEAKYADTMEREMYNGWLPGVGADGKGWSYTNPLRWYGREQTLHGNDSHGRHLPGKEDERSGHRICCPTNMLRGFAEMHGFFYSRADAELWVHHYGGSTYDDGTIRLAQTTRYPWDGEISIVIEKATAKKIALKLRIPDWCETAVVLVNGKPSGVDPNAGTYISLEREWQAGDRVELHLEMKPRLITADYRIETARGQVAIMRGPIVYCLESVDQPGSVDIFDMLLPADITLTAEHRDTLLGGLTVLTGIGLAACATGKKNLYRSLGCRTTRPVEITLIPYYAWANRGVSRMTVWVPLWAAQG